MLARGHRTWFFELEGSFVHRYVFPHTSLDWWRDMWKGIFKYLCPWLGAILKEAICESELEGIWQVRIWDSIQTMCSSVSGPVSPTSLWFFPFPFFTFKVNGESGNLGKGTCPVGGAQHIFCFPHCALQGVDLSLFHMGPPRGSVLELTGWKNLLDFFCTCSKDYPQSYSQKTYQRSIRQNLSMKSDSWFLSSHFLLYVSLLANYRMSGWTTKGKGIHGSYTYCL